MIIYTQEYTRGLLIVYEDSGAFSWTELKKLVHENFLRHRVLKLVGKENVHFTDLEKRAK